MYAEDWTALMVMGYAPRHITGKHGHSPRYFVDTNRNKDGSIGKYAMIRAARMFREQALRGKSFHASPSAKAVERKLRLLLATKLPKGGNK